MEVLVAGAFFLAGWLIVRGLGAGRASEAPAELDPGPTASDGPFSVSVVAADVPRAIPQRDAPQVGRALRLRRQVRIADVVDEGESLTVTLEVE